MKKQSFLEGSLILIASAALSKVIGAVFRIPLANMLGGTGMGYFSSAYGIFTAFYAVSVTGLPVAAAALTAESRALSRFGRMKKVKSEALKICALFGAAFTFLMLALSYPFCAFISKSPEAVFSAAVIAPSVFFCCVTAVFRGYYEGQRNMYPTAVSQLTEALVKLAAGLALCYAVLKTAERSPDRFEELTETVKGFFPFEKIKKLTSSEMKMPLAAAAAAAGVTLSSAAGTIFIILRDIAAGDGIKAEKALNEDTTDIPRRFFGIMLPVAAGALVTNLTSLIDLSTIIRSMSAAVKRSPEYFTKYLSGGITPELLPNFFFGSFAGLAVTVFNLIPSFTNMFGKSAVPAIAESFAEKDSAELRKRAMNAVFTASFIAVPAGIGISALSPQILELLFPSRKAETAICVLPLRVLGIGVIFLSVSSVLFAVLQAAGKSAEPVRIMLCGAAVKLLLNIALVSVPRINITGAAVSTVLCYLMIMVLSIKSAAICAGINEKEVYSLLLRLFFCGSLCGAAAYLSDGMLSLACDTRFTLLFSVPAGVIIYIISTHLTGILNKSTLKLLIS